MFLTETQHKKKKDETAFRLTVVYRRRTTANTHKEKHTTAAGKTQYFFLRPSKETSVETKFIHHPPVFHEEQFLFGEKNGF